VVIKWAGITVNLNSELESVKEPFQQVDELRKLKEFLRTNQNCSKEQIERKKYLEEQYYKNRPILEKIEQKLKLIFELRKLQELEFTYNIKLSEDRKSNLIILGYVTRIENRGIHVSYQQQIKIPIAQYGNTEYGYIKGVGEPTYTSKKEFLYNIFYFNMDTEEIDSDFHRKLYGYYDIKKNINQVAKGININQERKIPPQKQKKYLDIKPKDGIYFNFSIKHKIVFKSFEKIAIVIKYNDMIVDKLYYTKSLKKEMINDIEYFLIEEGTNIYKYKIFACSENFIIRLFI
jgi:hypothetical protein